MKNKNIYMGPNSTAKMPMFGTVDTDYEIVLNIISTAYDALNNIMLTRNSGSFDKTTVQEINGRFGILRSLCHRYAPNDIGAVNQMHHIVLENHAGRLSDDQALMKMRDISEQYGMNPGILNEVAMRINNAEMIRHQPKSIINPMEQMFPFFINPQRGRKK